MSAGFVDRDARHIATCDGGQGFCYQPTCRCDCHRPAQTTPEEPTPVKEIKA